MTSLRGLGLVLLAGCGSCEEPLAQLDAGPSASAVVSAAPPPSGTWAEAASGDALALARLAQEHTAPELLALAGAHGDTALAALAHAPDAELVLGDLAVMARDPERATRALHTIVAVAGRPPRRGEPLDPDSLRRCIDALDALSRDPAARREHRVLAVSALRGFVRGGYMPEARVTTELDD